MKDWILLLVFALALSLPLACSAQDDPVEMLEPEQEEMLEPAPAEGLEYSSGEVVRVDAALNTIVVNEYDVFNDTEQEVSYVLDKDVEFKNAASLADIAAGSYVDIDYTVDIDGKKIAKSIYVYQAESGEDTEM